MQVLRTKKLLHLQEEVLPFFELKELEKERNKLYLLVTNLGLNHQLVLKQSNLLDKLVYQQQSKDKGKVLIMQRD